MNLDSEGTLPTVMAECKKRLEKKNTTVVGLPH